MSALTEVKVSFTSIVGTVFMANLMYRTGLVPRFIPVLGLMGGPQALRRASHRAGAERSGSRRLGLS